MYQPFFHRSNKESSDAKAEATVGEKEIPTKIQVSHEPQMKSKSPMEENPTNSETLDEGNSTSVGLERQESVLSPDKYNVQDSDKR